ncbi:hypothetical protein HPP92_009804 [Vanilla planifolia]|uniref:Uncharacterized protein n=1 Tax=Vanilla planifolia TaxID=51239 RepID=A0A835REY9_VANPL|nr:hypothetical protein HPP92_009804 [Vanilla planifolia]
MKKKKKKPSGDSASWIRASPLHQLRPSIPIMWSSHSSMSKQEHDPLEILESMKVCTAEAQDKAAADGYNVDRGRKAIRIKNQRETTVIWGKLTELPLYNANVVDVLDSMHRDFIKGSEGKSKGEFLLRVDEGAAVNDLLMQMQHTSISLSQKKENYGQVIVEVISMILGLS